LHGQYKAYARASTFIEWLHTVLYEVVIRYMYTVMDTLFGPHGGVAPREAIGGRVATPTYSSSSWESVFDFSGRTISKEGIRACEDLTDFPATQLKKRFKSPAMAGIQQHIL
jgi:hypothetical protein